MLYGLVDGISCVCYPFIDTCACVCVFVHVCKLHTHHVYAAHCSTYALTCVAAQSCVQTALKWQQYLKEFGFQALAPPWLLVVQPSNAFNTTEHLHIFSGYHGQFRPKHRLSREHPTEPFLHPNNSRGAAVLPEVRMCGKSSLKKLRTEGGWGTMAPQAGAEPSFGQSSGDGFTSVPAAAPTLCSS